MTELLQELEALLNDDKPLANQKKFKELSLQLKATLREKQAQIRQVSEDGTDEPAERTTANIDTSADAATTATADETPTDTLAAPAADTNAKDSKESETPTEELELESPEAKVEAPQKDAVNEKRAEEPIAPEKISEPNADDAAAAYGKTTENDVESSDAGDAMSPELAELHATRTKLKEISDSFKEKLAEARTKKRLIEEETVAQAKVLIKELQALVENEENIGKAFNGFSAIRDKWKELPKVSNDAYRDLNAEYNKYAEQFFYNINIYKELKDLDLKHNLESKLQVLADQKKLLEINDIRLLEVEVRMNQDRWNEIGPTYKEKWDEIKDEFWSVTRSIYGTVQAYYDGRRIEQGQNLLKKKELLVEIEQLTALEINSVKKWHEKTDEVKAKQQEWKMIGLVPRQDAKELNKTYRKHCDGFFDRKKAYFQEIFDEQRAHKEAKMKLVEQAEALKDDEDFAATSSALINLQKQWKEIGSAGQRDENWLWRKFRSACDEFFQKRNKQKTAENAEQKENLTKKNAVMDVLGAFEPSANRNENIEALKKIAEDWRAVGHVPFKAKDKINKAYKDLMDEKYGLLKIDRREKEKIRFEQRLEDIKEADNGDHLKRKEDDFIRNKISKLESEAIQLENNIGFFSSSKGASALRQGVEEKIEKIRDEVKTLREQLSTLRKA